MDTAAGIDPAGDELSRVPGPAQHLATRRGPAAAIGIWSGLHNASRWFDEAQTACTTAPPDAAVAAEWMLDNHYVLRRALRQIGKDLPPQFYARLPALTAAHHHLPRAFALAHDLLRSTRLQLSFETIVAYVRAYQQHSVLSIAELWAFASMLRLACLEIAAGGLADLFSSRIGPGPPLSTWARMPAVTATERVARAIANLSVIASIRWPDVVDRTSVVEEALGGDPSGAYARMDFATRDRYRRAVEELAAQSARAEPFVAARAVACAEAAAPGQAEHHVGYWLVDSGRRHLERQLGARVPLLSRLRNRLLRHPGAFYAAIASLCSAGTLIAPFVYLRTIGAPSVDNLIAIGLTLLPASALAMTLANWIVTLIVAPRRLPRIDCSDGLPKDARTIVVVPAIIGGIAEADSALERIEAHWLTNGDPLLRVALLADPVDAATDRIALDDDIERRLDRGIDALNEHYARDGVGPFHLLIRPRRYNPAERCWMAWERKRGKLEQFVQLLLNGRSAAFSRHVGSPSHLSDVRFMVTVDADTILPTGSVAKLVGTLLHPLNRAIVDPTSGRVTRGFAIVQPRVEIAPTSGQRTRFAQYYAGDTAIDIYSTAVSDVYQDLFASGSFVGKGIIDLRAFERATRGCIAENSILSHDLLEGALARAALASDIVLYEDFPATHQAYMARWHRWVRGDWQLLPWLFGTPASAANAPSLSLLDRWKIIDNLRRSLVPPALLALLIAGWLWLPGDPFFWTFLAVFAQAGHLFTELVTGLARGRRRGAVKGLPRNLLNQSGRWLLALVYLPLEAIAAVHAIAVTLWRLLVTRRSRLEWTSAAHVAARWGRHRSRLGVWRRMWTVPALAAGLGAAIVLARSGAVGAALPLLALWIASPEISVRIARPPRRRQRALEADQIRFLRMIARRTWLYFETFAGPADHWLPCDNYQAPPHEELAHRTSPTNIGMLLLASAAALDLGYIGTRELAQRTANIFATLARLERYRGHFLNWYDTVSLRCLEPRYASTVDSGNLAACLMAQAATIEESKSAPALSSQRWDGLSDVVDLLQQALDDRGQRTRSAALAEIEASIASLRGRPSDWCGGLARLRGPQIDAVESEVAGAIDGGIAAAAHLHEIHEWLNRLRHQIEAMQHDLEALAPWCMLPPAPPSLSAVREKLDATLSSGRLDEDRFALARAGLEAAATDDPAGQNWLELARRAVDAGATARNDLAAELDELAGTAMGLVKSMDFAALYDRDRRLFFIGFNVSADQLDAHHYDLLASEARLASLVAIALKQVPVEHWFHLGRPLIRGPDGLMILSWNGSMFEYLMPRLLLRAGSGTLLASSERQAVELQIRHGNRARTPWGISESAFAARDPEHRYRYQAFGVSELGLRRGGANDHIIAPYASALALPVAPQPAVENLRKLWSLGVGGQFGFFDAADYSVESTGERFTPVAAFMAHHQGMIIGAIVNLLNDDIFVHRLQRLAQVRVASLLLDERIPRELAPEVERPIEGPPPPAAAAAAAIHEWVPAPRSAQIQLLGNGRLASWVSASGSGAIRWRGLAVTRPASDGRSEGGGPWLYLHDDDRGALWSASPGPTRPSGRGRGRTVFNQHLVQFHREDHGIRLHADICVAPNDDVEIRRLTVTNESSAIRRLRITSYLEAVLTTALEHERHPAFSKLFVEGEYLPEIGGLLLSRRRRQPDEPEICLLHRLVQAPGDPGAGGYEVDRAVFVGRLRDLRDPRGARAALDGTGGCPLDPIAALQTLIELSPFERRELAFVTVAAATREAAIEIAGRHATLGALDWTITDAASQASREIARLGLVASQLPGLQQLASRLIAGPGAPPDVGQSNRLGQSGLWPLGISGDRPILLFRLSGSPGPMLTELLQAQALWRGRGFDVDLVVLRHVAGSYLEPARDAILTRLRELGSLEQLGRVGGVHLVGTDQIAPEAIRLLEAAARVVLDDTRPLTVQLADATPTRAGLPRFSPGGMEPDPEIDPVPAVADLDFANGWGGFTRDGREYVIHLEPGGSTPAPWSNVLANQAFGTIVTEAGCGFSWACNSGENRLTYWSNDPVSDRAGEALYLRDEASGAIWSPTPLPAGAEAACQIRHGTGYSSWRQHSHALEQEMQLFVPADGAVKIIRLRLKNRSARPRRVTATYYAEWLLGALPSIATDHVVCDYDAAAAMLTARNDWNSDFAGRLAFVAASRPAHCFTTDRREFLGDPADSRLPRGLTRWGLSNRTDCRGAPCAAYQVHLDIPPEGCEEVIFVLGQGSDAADAARLAAHWRVAANVTAAFDALGAKWDEILGTVEVTTPDRAFDLMTNRWLRYQSRSSRLFARAGFYQASGAIGYRDQLQDVLAFLDSEPEQARAHILLCAAHQFQQGDVLHWWHPPSDRGVRTRCSDDLLWLPYVAAAYVAATGDTAIMDVEVPFLSAPELEATQQDRYATFEATAAAPLFDHCERALERGLTAGAHGLPLIGGGDWNDGFDNVGRAGRGESVWLAWFGATTAGAFADVADRCGKPAAAVDWRERAQQLRAAAEDQGWDGAWYRRAFDDSGAPWGSAANDECRIDSISQSWATFAGAAAAPAHEALRSAIAQLAPGDQSTVRLLWPPFDKTPRHPGYIKGYPPGIRENGGHYAHAAAWLGLALAEQREGDAAYDIFNRLNPIGHAASRSSASRYRVEPYVIAADIGTAAPHAGRGGWTWYTGAAAWTWRLAVEGILGVRLQGGLLTIKPCLPRSWGGATATLRRPGGSIHLSIEDPVRVGSGDAEMWIDDARSDATTVAFPSDGSTRRVKVRLTGSPVQPPAEKTSTAEAQI